MSRIPFSIPELEKRMRPGAYSGGGFLGPTESLEAVLIRDRQTLEEAQVTWAYFDFLILNRRLGESVTGPGLIVHLIREHQFFEGSESPYRLEPSKAIRVLDLASGL